MKVAYIAHAVGNDVNGNIKKILKIVEKINKEETEIVPFAPYIVDCMALDDSVFEERERGFKNNLHYFKSGLIDEVRLYGDIISPGMEIEIRWANRYGIPVVSYIGKDQKKSIQKDSDPALFDSILAAVCNEFRIFLPDLKLRCRKREIVTARQNVRWYQF